MGEFLTIDQYGKSLDVSVRRSKKAKNIAIRITYNNLVELVLPYKIDIKFGHRFLLKQESWIRKKIQPIITKQQIIDHPISILDKSYNISYIISNNNVVRFNHDTIEVYAKNNLMQKTILKLFFKNQLLQEIIKLANKITQEHQLYYNKIRIMDNISKWGSCSSKGTLSSNWHLIFAPIEVIKYLVVHEMSHLKEMNHSQNFWFLVSTIYPQYYIARFWLKNKGRSLYNQPIFDLITHNTL